MQVISYAVVFTWKESLDHTTIKDVPYFWKLREILIWQCKGEE
jgi:hypothetical protein